MQKIVNLKLSDIKPYENNPRFNDNGVDALAKGIAEFGFLNPIVVDKNHVIINGHTRYKAAKKLNLTSVPCIVRDDLSDDAVKALRIADNKTSEFATWNYEELALQAKELNEKNYDLSVLGFDESVIADLLSKKEEDYLVVGETDPDALPLLSGKVSSKVGEMYECGNHLLLCADAANASASNILYSRGDAHLLLARVMAWDDHVADVLAECSRHLSGTFYVMCDNESMLDVRMSCDACGLATHEALLWLKNKYNMSRYQYQELNENIFYGWKEGCGHKWYSDRKQTNLLEYNNAPSGEVPVAMMIYLIRNSSCAGETVLNVLSNTGSALIACEQTRRKCRMIVETPEICDLARKRWAEFKHGSGCDWKKLTPAVGGKK